MEALIFIIISSMQLNHNRVLESRCFQSYMPFCSQGVPHVTTYEPFQTCSLGTPSPTHMVASQLQNPSLCSWCSPYIKSSGQLTFDWTAFLWILSIQHNHTESQKFWNKLIQTNHANSNSFMAAILNFTTLDSAILIYLYVNECKTVDLWKETSLAWMYHMYWWCKSKFPDKHLFTHCTSIWYKLLHNLEQWFVLNWKKSDILWIRGNLSKIDLLLKTKEISWVWNLKFHLELLLKKRIKYFKFYFLGNLNKAVIQRSFLITDLLIHPPGRSENSHCFWAF